LHRMECCNLCDQRTAQFPGFYKKGTTIFMIKSYIGLNAVSGSLIVLDGVTGASFDEMVELHLPGGNTRTGRVVQIDGSRVVVQVFEGTSGVALSSLNSNFTGKPMEMPLSPEILGRIFDGAGRPADGYGEIYPIIGRTYRSAHADTRYDTL